MLVQRQYNLINSWLKENNCSCSDRPCDRRSRQRTLQEQRLVYMCCSNY